MNRQFACCDDEQINPASSLLVVAVAISFLLLLSEHFVDVRGSVGVVV